MDKTTLKALKGSIHKWWSIAYDNGIDRGMKNCPLCKTFYNSYSYWLSEDGCSNCPVYKDTGKGGCTDTPYEAYGELNWDERNVEKQAKRLAIKEMKYLISLLPPGETWDSPDGRTYYND